MSMAVLPPTLKSTIASSVVGICTKRTPRMLMRSQGTRGTRDKYSQGRRSNESDQVSDDSSAESKYDRVASALVE